MDEAEELKRANEGMKLAKAKIKNLKLMVDTNVLIAACGKKTDQQEMLAFICGQNETHISTTIFWEFLRDVGLDTFRNRFDFLINNNRWFEIESDNQPVKTMFKVIWGAYLCCYRNDIKAMANRKIRDMWIVAATVQKEMDHILTFDNSDFPDEIFDKQSFYVGGNQQTLFVMTINWGKLSGILKCAIDNGILIPFRCFTH